MFENITLEMSLKPFKHTDEEYIRKICRDVFDGWRPLIKNRKCVSVMLWVGDGSEILDYAGRPGDSFEWCRFVGTANLPYPAEGEGDEISLHKRRRDYMPDAPRMTYSVLQQIVSTLKEEGMRALPDTKIRIGETFDIGPEFAISDFKYNRHTEITSGAKLDKFGFVDATATLRADSRPYAAYPDGIPEGTPFGTFLGKQSECFLRDMGFDYLWLSNGLGFSSNPWDKTGKIFDGERYYPEKLEDTRRKVFDFWRLFRAECSYPLETRGTNNSVGIDYATDGVPLYDIYNAGFDITPPPNSPWAALNDNYGLELMGHMTRICELPGNRFLFRYYIHDPWWVNSPWYDRYDGSPCDIYLPMAVSRITPEGRVESANSLNILSIDNSWGDMPDCCINEPLPHLLKAEKDTADEPSPLVWVYPMREYTTSADADLLREMNDGDSFISSAINLGLPLCCVTSTDSFLKHAPDLYAKSIIISPVPERTEVLNKLFEISERGTPVLVYGSEKKLDIISDRYGFIKIDTSQPAANLRRAVAECGYSIDFKIKTEGKKPPTMALYRRDRALMLSAYNPDTTTDCLMYTPLGAPIFIGMETEMRDGHASYRFARAEHRECRVFAEQAQGVISCREAPPVNVRYRRAIRIRGLDNATVRLFSEEGCECMVSVASLTDDTPIPDVRFTCVSDEKYGKHLLGTGVTGDIWFLIGKRGTEE